MSAGQQYGVSDEPKKVHENVVFRVKWKQWQSRKSYGVSSFAKTLELVQFIISGHIEERYQTYFYLQQDRLPSSIGAKKITEEQHSYVRDGEASFYLNNVWEAGEQLYPDNTK